VFPDLFSKRYGLRPTPQGLMYEDVPERARVGLFHIVRHFFEDEYLDLYNVLCIALRVPLNTSLANVYLASGAIEDLIMNCQWWQFYDACEVLWQSSLKYTRDELAEEINTLFREEHLGFELREGKVEKTGSGFIDARVKEARYLLKEPEFKGADEHFEKALKALNIRPNPDVENCIKDAVAAIESVGRIIVNDEKPLLSDIIKEMAKSKIIPKPLDEAIQKIYAYRGDQPGVAHGLVGASKVTVDEAEFVLAISAAIIIYLVKKRHYVENI
jgi:tetratricopeptide (TPR) repeat protein